MTTQRQPDSPEDYEREKNGTTVNSSQKKKKKKCWLGLRAYEASGIPNVIGEDEDGQDGHNCE